MGGSFVLVGQRRSPQRSIGTACAAPARAACQHEVGVKPCAPRGALVSRAQRSTKWCAAGLGPPHTELLAVPDQRCTASGTRRRHGCSPRAMAAPAPPGNAAMAAKNKYLAGSDKTRTRGETTKKWDRQ